MTTDISVVVSTPHDRIDEVYLLATALIVFGGIMALLVIAAISKLDRRLTKRANDIEKRLGWVKWRQRKMLK